MLDQLASCGYVVLPDEHNPLLEQALLQALYQDISCHYQANALEEAKVGQARQRVESIRADEIAWLEGRATCQQQFLRVAEGWMAEFNRSLFLGLNAMEFHYARYPEGGGYALHWDNFQGNNQRILTFITYLNLDWQPGDGGELLLYADDEQQLLASVAPRWGTTVFFLSSDFPHQVLPAVKPRRSLTGWFRRNHPLDW